MAVILESPALGIYVVTVTDLRAPLTDELDRTVRTLIGGGERQILLDLSAVSSIDAAGIGALVHAYNRVVAAGGVLSVVGVHPRVRETLALAGLLDFLSAPIPLS